MLTEADRAAVALRINKHMPSHLQYAGRDLDNRLNEVSRQVSNWWNRQASDSLFWLAFGVDIMFDCGFLNPRKHESRESLIERFDNMVAEGWNSRDGETGSVWLRITPYTLWRMVEDAREAGFAEVEDTLFEAARGVSDGSSIAKAIERSFAKSVQEWQTAFERAA